MKNSYQKDYRKVKLAEPRSERLKLGKAKKGLVICSVCNIFFYQKSWHHGADAFIAKRENKDMPVSFTVCPACQMIKRKEYMGKVVVTGIPAAQKSDLMNMIRGYGERAFDRDPLDRLIAVSQSGATATVTTTKNQLAQRLAEKIKDAFNTVKLSFAHGKTPGDAVTVTVAFLKK
ncbi:MAG: hypothetical protein KGI60_04050 [Patescibacteria group bacterium]|nr:hypothetical protein [Patescibacteria group bacterium]